MFVYVGVRSKSMLTLRPPGGVLQRIRLLAFVLHQLMYRRKRTPPTHRPLTTGQLQDILRALHTDEVIAGEKQELMGHECAYEEMHNSEITANYKWRLKKPADNEPSSTSSGPEVTEVQSKGQSNVSVWASIGGRPVKGMVDSCAAVSVASGHGSENRFNEAPDITSVKIASGDELPLLGKIEMELTISKKTYAPSAYVVRGLNYSVVLRRDFLESHYAVVDFGSQIVTLDACETTEFAYGDKPPLKCAFIAPKIYVIPAFSETVIPANLGCIADIGAIGLVESSNRLVKRYKLCGAAALARTTCEHSIPFRLLNPNNTPVTIYRGTNLGEFTESSPTVYLVNLLDAHPGNQPDHSTGNVERNGSPEPMQTAAVPSSSSCDVPVDMSQSDLNEKETNQLT